MSRSAWHGNSSKVRSTVNVSSVSSLINMWWIYADAPKSAVRKAGRGMPTLVYIYSVSRTTFRGDFFGVVFLVPLCFMCTWASFLLSLYSTVWEGHCLGVLASWIVQVGIDICRLFRSKDDSEEKVRLLGKKVYIATVRCGASLVFASIGAGIGASFLRPSTGQWIGEFVIICLVLIQVDLIIYICYHSELSGCAIGDVAGPVIVSLCFEKVLHLEL